VRFVATTYRAILRRHHRHCHLVKPPWNCAVRNLVRHYTCIENQSQNSAPLNLICIAVPSVLSVPGRYEQEGSLQRAACKIRELLWNALSSHDTAHPVPRPPSL
jgi:hypothetical protein